MRVFTLISENGRAVSIMKRIQQEGHRTVTYINNPEYKSIGDGIVEKHKSRSRLVINSLDRGVLDDLLHPIPDCVIFDDCNQFYGSASEIIRQRGIPVFGCSEWSGRLGSSLGFPKTIMKVAGLSIIKNSQESVSLTTDLWFNGESVCGIVHSISDMNLMDDDRGPSTPGMGAICWTGYKDKLFIEGIGRFIPLLSRLKHRGTISLNYTVSEKDIVGLELSAKLNLSTLFTTLEMSRHRVSDLVYGLSSGVIKDLKFKSEFGIGINIAVLPFPMETSFDDEILIEGINTQNSKHLWLYDVEIINDKHYTTGMSGLVGTVTARGDNVNGFDPFRDSKRRALRTIGNLSVEGLMYRKDIGNKLYETRSKLQKWGWI